MGNEHRGLRQEVGSSVFASQKYLRNIQYFANISKIMSRVGYRREVLTFGIKFRFSYFRYMKFSYGIFVI